MNILFDLIVMQQGKGYSGAATYTQCVLNKLLEMTTSEHAVYGLYDSSKEFTPHYNIPQVVKQHHIVLLDVHTNTIGQLIAQYHIDTYFVPLAQFIAPYDLSDINCRTVMLIHDIFDVENNDSHLSLSLFDRNLTSKKEYLKHCIKILLNKYGQSVNRRYAGIMKLYNQPNVIAGTVSEYSKYALKYYFPEIEKDIHVWYSPAKQTQVNPAIDNPALSRYIQQQTKYFLMVSANRTFKNAQLAVKAFKRFYQEHSDWHMILINYPYSDDENNIHSIKSLSDSDLEHAYKNAQALVFPSYFEGFGYPPIEALKYGVPSIVSNVTSITELLTDSAYFFSPMYTADLYRAMVKFSEQKDNLRPKKALQETYKRIHERQDADLEALVNCILNQ